MLRSFVGTIDERGLRTLIPEPDERQRPGESFDRVAAIWAVVDSADLPEIRQALRCGERRRALQLLSAYARSLGSVPD